MTPEELRADIPALADGVYLNTGASGPAPRRVQEAASEFVRYHESEAPVGEGAYPAAFDALDGARETVADFLSADHDEVALTESTADGIARVAAGIDWKEGDTVARTDLEHSAGVLPWWNLQERGVSVRIVPTDDGRLDMDAVKDAVADARLFCLSSITWNYGTELPISEVVDVAHDAGCRVLVDAVQSFGQKPVDVTEWGADFVVGAGHKWLLGPWGAGVLYVDSEVFHTSGSRTQSGDADVAAELSPAQVGYRSVEDPEAAQPAYKTGAPRFEVGTTSPGPYVGLETAIQTIESVGYDTISERQRELTDRLKAGLGDRLLSPREFESGLVTFEVDDPADTVQRLKEAGIIIRELPAPEAVRASVHVFNTAEDVDLLLDAL